ncbi:MAG: SigE family RNA polymerase sigma factor [Actinobacteria bacterium]|nr:SigE family RNA polymerase sigma factor [Actinomycetota bacterium]
MSATERTLTGERPTPARLAELYERHVGRAVGLARLLTGDPHLAEDLAHEAFLRVAGRLGHLRSPGAFDQYLRRTVVNLCRARFRRLRVERAWIRRQAPVESTARPDHDPEVRDAVRRALERLPYRQRAAIDLRYYEDLTVEQTGRALRCSTRAARSLLARGMSALRELLPEEEA